jgi:hypothetical protein
VCGRPPGRATVSENEPITGLRELIHELALNVAVLTSSVSDLKGILAGIQQSSASKESVEAIASRVRELETGLKEVDDKHDKKWDRLLWAVFSIVLGAIVLGAISQGGLGK